MKITGAAIEIRNKKDKSPFLLNQMENVERTF